MVSITIHPSNTQQVKAFEEMAIALQVPYKVDEAINEDDEAAFMEKFNAGIELETAREHLLTHVRQLWSK